MIGRSPRKMKNRLLADVFVILYFDRAKPAKEEKRAFPNELRTRLKKKPAKEEKRAFPNALRPKLRNKIFPQNTEAHNKEWIKNINSA